MKKITLGLSLLICAFANAQTTTPNWLEEVIVEKYYISTVDDSINSVGTLPVGSVTYRVFADMLPGYRFTNIFGEQGYELRIATTTKFFNNEDRGAISPAYTKTQAKNNTVMLDSWFSIGAACNDNWAVMKTEDDGVATVVNADGILKNDNPAVMGIPLTKQDGMIAKKSNENILGVTLSPGLDLGIFDATSQQGGVFSSYEASVAVLGGQKGPTGTNRVLIGQFTTNGQFSFELNIIVQDSTGNSQLFVAKNPGLYPSGKAVSIPSLIYPAPVPTSNVPPVVSITAPAQYSKYKITDMLDVKANATDTDGTIAKVEFFINNGLQIIDSVAPYAFDYALTTYEGKTLKLGAVAVDNKGARTIAEPVIVFVEGSNISPYAKITSPATASFHKKNSDVVIKADAMDTDGTIKMVEFIIAGKITPVNIGKDSVAPYEITWKATATSDTALAIYARAIDDKGAYYETEQVKLIITDNTAPAVNILTPVDGVTVKEGEEVNITANAIDDGEVDLVEFFINGLKIGEDGAAPYEVKWKALLGNYDIIAVATDNKGVKTVSALVKVIVEKPNGIHNVNARPGFKVYPNPAENIVVIEFTGGKQNSYKIYDIKGAIVLKKQVNNISGETLEKVDVSKLSNGQYMIELVVDGVKSTRKMIKK